MNVTTNKPGTKLTRPVPVWKRVLAFLAGIVSLLLALGAFGNGAGWVVLVPIIFGVGCFIFAAEKYETIG